MELVLVDDTVEPVFFENESKEEEKVTEHPSIFEYLTETIYYFSHPKDKHEARNSNSAEIKEEPIFTRTPRTPADPSQSNRRIGEFEDDDEIQV